MFKKMVDDNCEAARREQVRLDLNAGNLDSVIAYLEPKYKESINLTEEELDYLASAYIGKAGFDVPLLIERVTEEEDTNEDTEIFTLIADIIDEDADGELLQREVTNEGDLNNPNPAPGKIEYINHAIDVLYPRFNSQLEGSLQRGVYAVVHVVLTISLAISDQYGYYNVDDSILLTGEDLENECERRGEDKIIFVEDIRLLSRLDNLNRDLRIIDEALDASEIPSSFTILLRLIL